MKNIGSMLSTIVALMVIWVCLTLNFSISELGLGIVFSVLIAVSTRGGFTSNLFRLLKPARLAALLVYIFFFLSQMVKANIDVLFRVLRPVVPVRPGIVGADIGLRNLRGRIIIANSITLTPGTLTVDLIDDRIYVHWISLPDGDATAETQKLVDGFAKRLEKVLD